MSGPSNQPLGHVWLSQEDLRSARGPAPDHAPLSPQSSIASSGSGGSEHLEEAGLGGGSGLHRSSFHEEGSGMRGEYERPSVQLVTAFSRLLRRLRSPVSLPKSCTHHDYSQLPTNSFCACLRGNTFSYHQVAVVCMCHSERETGRLGTAVIQTFITVKRIFFATALAIIASSHQEYVG